MLWLVAVLWIGVWLGLTPDPSRWLVRPGRLSNGSELVSILVSARNEESRVLRSSITSMLRQDYPNLEVVAVDDRSTDRTLEILRSIPGLTAIQGVQPPHGWVGKPHGLLQAMAVARGEWLLITDADILFHPAAVATALELCRERHLDVLSLWPRVECETFWEKVIMPLDLAVTAILFPLERVNGTRHRDAFTIGGFTLMRRQAFESIGGFAAIRAEVADDFALGILFKKAGFRIHMGFSPELLTTRDYSGFAQIWEGLTRKLFSNFIYIPIVRAFRQRFRAVDEWRGRHRRMFRAGMGIAAGLAAVLSLTITTLPVLWLPGKAATLCYAINCWIHRQYARMLGVPARYSLLAPLGYALYVAILVVAAWRVLSGRGLTWRGRRIY